MARRCISSSRKFGKKIRKKSSRRGRPRRRRTWSRTHRRSGGTTEYTTTFENDPFSGFVYYYTTLGVENHTLWDLKGKLELTGEGEKQYTNKLKKYTDQFDRCSTLLKTTKEYYDKMTMEERAKLLDPKQFTEPFSDLLQWIFETYGRQEHQEVLEMRQCINSAEIAAQEQAIADKKAGRC